MRIKMAYRFTPPLELATLTNNWIKMHIKDERNIFNYDSTIPTRIQPSSLLSVIAVTELDIT